MLAHEGEVHRGLLRRAQVVQDGMHHGQEAIAHTRLAVARVEQGLGRSAGGEDEVARQDSLHHQGLAKLAVDAPGLGFQRGRSRGMPGVLHGPGQGRQRLMVQDHRPGAAQPLAQRRIGGLQGVVPVAVAVGRQGGAGYATPPDDAECPVHMPQDRRRPAPAVRRAIEGHLGIEEGAIARAQHMARCGEQRPEDDVAMRIPRPQLPLALDELKPLRPVAVLVLRGEDPQQEVPRGFGAVQREQHLQRTLAHVAGAPAPTGILLEPARRQVVHQRIVEPPRQHLREPSYLGRSSTLPRCAQPGKWRGQGRGMHVGHEPAEQIQAEGVAGRAFEDEERQPSRLPIREQAPVAVHALKGRVSERRHHERTFRKASVQITPVRHADEDILTLHAPGNGQGGISVVAAQRDVQSRQPRQGRAVQNARPEAQDVRAALHRADELDGAAGVSIESSGRSRAASRRRRAHPGDANDRPPARRPASRESETAPTNCAQWTGSG